MPRIVPDCHRCGAPDYVPHDCALRFVARPRSPIESMIDAAVRCVNCGAKPGECDCWSVALRCPQCKRTKRVGRETSDPPGTAVVAAVCNDCADQMRNVPDVLFFDADGKPLPFEKRARGAERG